MEQNLCKWVNACGRDRFKAQATSKGSDSQGAGRGDTVGLPSDVGTTWSMALKVH